MPALRKKARRVLSASVGTCVVVSLRTMGTPPRFVYEHGRCERADHRLPATTGVGRGSRFVPFLRERQPTESVPMRKHAPMATSQQVGTAVGAHLVGGLDAP